MNLFRSPSEKLAARLAGLESEAATLAARLAEAQEEDASAQARHAEDLADGLPVDKWRKSREAAEKKAADAERDLKAARDAAEIVRGKLVEARHAELLEDFRARYGAAEAALPGAVADVKATLLPFASALSRLEALRDEVRHVVMAGREAGASDLRTFGVPAVESIVKAAIPGGPGPSRWVSVDVPLSSEPLP